MKLSKSDSKELAVYLKKMDRQNDGIPYKIQDIAERAYYYSGMGDKELKALKARKKKAGTFAKKACKRRK